MKRKTENELWIEYLEIMNVMAETPGMYTLDNGREKIHNELYNKYLECFPEIIKERFNDICHSLEKVIDFNPPLAPYDSIKVYAKEIVSFMWGYGKFYITTKNVIRKYK